MLATIGFVAEQYVQFPGFPASEERSVVKWVKIELFLAKVLELFQGNCLFQGNPIDCFKEIVW